MTEFADLVSRALRHIDQAAEGHLPLGYRQAILASMGPRHSDRGRFRRTRLALLCLRRTEPIWRAQSRDGFIDDCLVRANELARRPRTQAAETAANAAWTEVVERVGTDPGLIGAAAAAKTLMTAVFDAAFSEDDLDLSRLDPDDFDRGDAAFFAAWLEAGGHPLDPSDENARREFWRWWLTEAVPAAYDSEPENTP